ncbi:MAG: hypothetical protein R3D59_13565 [Paracoccaceae bacterium]
MTDPDWVPIMKKAKAITDAGGRTSTPPSSAAGGRAGDRRLR